MRYRDLISESFMTGFNHWNGKYVEIYRNPTGKEWKSIADHGEVRAFLVGDDLLAWQVYDSVHQTVREELKLPKESIPLNLWIQGKEAVAVVTDNSKNTPLHHSPDVESVIINHPYFVSKRITVEVGYYDEAIVGPWHSPIFAG